MYIGIPLFHEYGVDPKHHVTITFNGHEECKQDYLKAVSALADTCQWWHANGNGRVLMRFGDTAAFNDNCWHSSVESTKLPRFRDRLIQELDRKGVYYSSEYAFRPHVTLNYGREPTDNPYHGITHSVSSYAVVSKNFGVSEIRV